MEGKMAGFILVLNFVGVILGIVVVVRMFQKLYSERHIGGKRN